MDNQKNHRELWQWLEDNPAKDPSQWPNWRGRGGLVIPPPKWNFACRQFNSDCQKCVLFKNKQCADGNIEKWHKATLQADKIELARKIKEAW